MSDIWPQGLNFFVLNSTEHDINHAHKYFKKMPTFVGILTLIGMINTGDKYAILENESKKNLNFLAYTIL